MMDNREKPVDSTMTSPPKETSTTEPNNPSSGQNQNTQIGQQKITLGSLKVQLVANGQVIASSEDPKLWQDVLAAITGHVPQPLQHSSSSPSSDVGRHNNGSPPSTVALQGSNETTHDFSADVAKFARDIGVTPEELVAACDPQKDTPYLHLDHHAWEAMKKQTPNTGRHALSPIVPAATLLALWFRHKKLGNPTLKQAQAVLDTIEVVDKHPARGVKGRTWLQLKEDRIVLNPVHMSKAVALAKSFCTHQWQQEE